MGHRITQRIIECAICKKIPDDGEYLWEMGGEYWCEDCCNEDGEEQECNAPFNFGDSAV